MNKEILILPVLLLLLVGIVPGVSASVSVLYDDTWTSWSGGSATTAYYGSYSYYGVKSAWQGLGVSFSSQDWSSYDKINFYYKSTMSVTLRLYASDATNDFTKTLTAVADWTLVSISTADMTNDGGSPNNATVTAIYVNAGASGGTVYVDYIWLSGTNVYDLYIIGNDNAIMSPTIGTHSYSEGTPVRITATLMNNYTFTKFSVVNISETDDNPGWIVMLGDYTLTTVLQAPVADDYGATETNAAWTSIITQISLFWLPFAVFAVLSFWSIRMRGNYKYFGLVFPILGLTWAFAETSYPSALFYYVSATFFIFMLLFVGFKLAGLGGRNQRRWG